MVVRLCAIASLRWVDIDAAYYQINLLRQKPFRFLNLVLAWCRSRFHDVEELEKWEAALVDLLPWQTSASEAAAEIESASFLAMQAKGGG